MKRILRRFYPEIIFCIFLAGPMVDACGHGLGRDQLDTGVRTALNVLADVIDPAYSLAVDACVARQEVLTGEAEAGRTTSAAASAEIERIRVRCDQLREAFEQIRLVHDSARKAVERGELARAEELVAEVRARWRALDDGLLGYGATP